MVVDSGNSNNLLHRSPSLDERAFISLHPVPNATVTISGPILPLRLGSDIRAKHSDQSYFSSRWLKWWWLQTRVTCKASFANTIKWPTTTRAFLIWQAVSVILRTGLVCLMEPLKRCLFLHILNKCSVPVLPKECLKLAVWFIIRAHTWWGAMRMNDCNLSRLLRDYYIGSTPRELFLGFPYTY